MLNQIGSLIPSQEAEHHHPRQHHRPRIDHIFIGVLRSRAVRRFEDRVTIANVCPRSDAQPANLRRASVRNVIAIEIRRRQHGVLIRPRHHLLEDRVGNAVVDHEFLLPLVVAVCGIDTVEHVFHFQLHSVAKRGRSKLHPRLNQFSILRHRQVQILVLVADDPALALRDHLVAKLLGGQLVSPLAERALGKLLDVALVHQRHTLAASLQRMKNRHAHQAFGSGHRHRLDAHARIQPDLLLAALQHVFVEKLDQFRALRSSLFPLDACVHILSVLAVDHHIHAFGIFHRRRHALVVLHWTHAAIEIENLPQRNVERTNAAAHGRGQRALDGDAELANGVHSVIRQPVVEFRFRLFPGEYFIPCDSTFALIGFLHGRVEHA